MKNNLRPKQLRSLRVLEGKHNPLLSASNEELRYYYHDSSHARIDQCEQAISRKVTRTDPSGIIVASILGNFPVTHGVVFRLILEASS